MTTLEMSYSQNMLYILGGDLFTNTTTATSCRILGLIGQSLLGGIQATHG
jgi:hypothetical protein